MSDTVIENVSVPVTDEDNQDEVDDENLLSVLDLQTSTSIPINLKKSTSTSTSSKKWGLLDIAVAIFCCVLVVMFVVVIRATIIAMNDQHTKPRKYTK